MILETLPVYEKDVVETKGELKLKVKVQVFKDSVETNHFVVVFTSNGSGSLSTFNLAEELVCTVLLDNHCVATRENARWVAIHEGSTSSRHISKLNLEFRETPQELSFLEHCFQRFGMPLLPKPARTEFMGVLSFESLTEVQLGYMIGC